MNNQLYRSGQFASLCGISKSTLHYYVSLGLIVPVKETDTNYKYYSASQLRTVQLISILQQAGCSLEEINQYINISSEHCDFQSIIHEKMNILIQKRNELDCTIGMLQIVNSLSTFINSHPFQDIFFHQKDTSHILYFSEFSSPLEKDSPLYLKNLTKHIASCNQDCCAMKYPQGRILSTNSFVKKQYVYDGLFNFAYSSLISEKNKLLFPSGDYLVYISHDDKENEIQVYEKLHQYVQKNIYILSDLIFEITLELPRINSFSYERITLYLISLL